MGKNSNSDNSTAALNKILKMLSSKDKDDGDEGSSRPNNNNNKKHEAKYKNADNSPTLQPTSQVEFDMVQAALKESREKQKTEEDEKQVARMAKAVGLVINGQSTTTTAASDTDSAILTALQALNTRLDHIETFLPDENEPDAHDAAAPPKRPRAGKAAASTSKAAPNRGKSGNFRNNRP